MAQIWKYHGYEIDEGLKPHDGNYKHGWYQYFFLVKQDGRRLMKLCVWGPEPYVDRISGAQDSVEYLRQIGLPEVAKRVDENDFDNLLIELDETGQRLIRLDELDEKKT
jgi:hypothetical protein